MGSCVIEIWRHAALQGKVLQPPPSSETMIIRALKYDPDGPIVAGKWLRSLFKSRPEGTETRTQKLTPNYAVVKRTFCFHLA
ncbi:hypothetical protein Q8A67_006522 [Cirrhinus molitorella]|uniref:Uncharacterized protein n=1 Tax=Cirrhinus molitorella TaxID=172907 RepID=A0AA88U1C5_9TELE|nr:hypothetical protein Q8A67_006522 [Cirrhinus molitorella]